MGKFVQLWCREFNREDNDNWRFDLDPNDVGVGAMIQKKRNFRVFDEHNEDVVRVRRKDSDSFFLPVSSVDSKTTREEITPDNRS